MVIETVYETESVPSEQQEQVAAPQHTGTSLAEGSKLFMSTCFIWDMKHVDINSFVFITFQRGILSHGFSRKQNGGI